MTLVRNPFDAGGYSLAEMTQAINILPNLYTRLGQIGLFRFEGVSQRSVIIEQYEGVLNLLPSVPLGGPATVGTREGRAMRSFALPWIPHDDVILPGDIQGSPALGVFDAADPLVEVMNRKLQLMRRKHAQIAATVAGMPDSMGGIRMAIRVAELARAGLTPDWMPGVVPRCVPVETRQNQHGVRAVTEVVGTERMLTRGKWRTVEVLACPVTWRPHPEQITSARRGYEDWWQALDWVRDGLATGGMLREVEVTAAMPKVRPWEDR